MGLPSRELYRCFTSFSRHFGFWPKIQTSSISRRRFTIYNQSSFRRCSFYSCHFFRHDKVARLLPLPASNDPIFKLWLSLLGPWRWFVKNATPLFTTMEGFCTLLVIQTAGRLATWLIRKRSDSWIIPLLLFSSCVFSSSLYFLYQIYTFPVTISLASATLIGAVLTVSVFLALFGIVSGRGNSVESSLYYPTLYIVFISHLQTFSPLFLQKHFFISLRRPLVQISLLCRP